MSSVSSPAAEPERAAPAGDIRVGDITNARALAIGPGAQAVINQALSRAEEAREQQQFEREQLAKAVARLMGELSQLAAASRPSDGNPYNYLLPYELADTAGFFGREAELAALTGGWLCDSPRCRLAVLQGDAGVGKTSLLQAGALPVVIANQHLPLRLRVTAPPLAASIKQCLLPDLFNATPDLARAPLQAFFQAAVEQLPAGKQVFVVLDQFEAFFDWPASDRQAFVAELAQCLQAAAPCSHWLLSVRSACFGQLDELQTVYLQPFTNTYRLSGLSRAAAHAAILRPAESQGWRVETGLPDRLFDDLKNTRDGTLDPSQLQMVCYALAQAAPAGQKQLTLAAYRQAGAGPGIVRDYLDNVLSRTLRAEDRQAAWQALAALAEQPGASLSQAAVLAALAANDVEAEQGRRVLGQLEASRLVRLSEAGCELAGDSLLARIQRWSAERAALVKARAETQRQIERIRGSALRGVLGGALGFVLAYLLAYQYTPSTPYYFLPYFVALRLVPGALAGFVAILAADLALASYTGPRRWLRWPVSAAGSAAGLAGAVLYHDLLRFSANLLPATLEGAVWGALMGLGLAWVLSRQRAPGTLLAGLAGASLAGGLGLWLADHFGHAFTIYDSLPVPQPPPNAWVAAAGAVMPLCVLGAALLARYRSEPTP